MPFNLRVGIITKDFALHPTLSALQAGAAIGLEAAADIIILQEELQETQGNALEMPGPIVQEA